MGCNCKWFGIIVALVILIVTIWPGLVGMAASWWIVVIAAVLILIHALKCGGGSCDSGSMPMKAAPVAKKAKKRKRK